MSSYAWQIQDTHVVSASVLVDGLTPSDVGLPNKENFSNPKIFVGDYFGCLNGNTENPIIEYYYELQATDGSDIWRNQYPYIPEFDSVLGVGRRPPANKPCVDRHEPIFYPPAQENSGGGN